VVALVLLLLLAWALVPLAGRRAVPLAPGAVRPTPRAVHAAPGGAPPVYPRSLTRAEWGFAALLALGWTLCGGTGHALFANADWTVRDAVLHDLVMGHWPVGYGELGSGASAALRILRAPLGYYLPAALLGKSIGLQGAYIALAAWTALGVLLFLLAVISLMPAGWRNVSVALAVVVLFSGLDVVGSLATVPDFLAHWRPERHLEWWAGRYQYSSMTTQLFWVPNHALGGWLAIALLARTRSESPAARTLDSMWPLLGVAVALTSPLTALGLVPFVLRRIVQRARFERSWMLWLRPRSLLPALLIGVALASYLALDAARIPNGVTFGGHGFGAAALTQDFLRQGGFFALEAGLIGAAVLMLVRSSDLVLALLILAVLPALRFGVSNDLAMRASIPSLVVLALAAARALTQITPEPRALAAAPGFPVPARKAVLAALLIVGAVTPLQEFARAVLLPTWPANLQARLIEAFCGAHPPHYVARLTGGLAAALLRAPQTIAPPPNPVACSNPARRLMQERGLQ
jgi:hypothetical protein